MVVCRLTAIHSSVGHLVLRPTFAPSQVPIAKLTELPVLNHLQPLLRGQFLESIALPGGVLLSALLEHHTVFSPLGLGIPVLRGGKRIFFRSALLLSVTAMTLAFLPNDPGRLYRPPRPSEDGDLWDLWYGVALGSTCLSLVATMLMAYRSLSLTNTSMYQGLSSAGSLPCASL
jgi:hypothetical protein